MRLGLRLLTVLALMAPAMGCAVQNGGAPTRSKRATVGMSPTSQKIEWSGQEKAQKEGQATEPFSDCASKLIAAFDDGHSLAIQAQARRQRDRRFFQLQNAVMELSSIQQSPPRASQVSDSIELKDPASGPKDTAPLTISPTIDLPHGNRRSVAASIDRTTEYQPWLYLAIIVIAFGGATCPWARFQRRSPRFWLSSGCSKMELEHRPHSQAYLKQSSCVNSHAVNMSLQDWRVTLFESIQVVPTNEEIKVETIAICVQWWSHADFLPIVCSLTDSSDESTHSFKVKPKADGLCTAVIPWQRLPESYGGLYPIPVPEYRLPGWICLTARPCLIEGFNLPDSSALQGRQDLFEPPQSKVDHPRHDLIHYQPGLANCESVCDAHFGIIVQPDRSNLGCKATPSMGTLPVLTHDLALPSCGSCELIEQSVEALFQYGLSIISHVESQEVILSRSGTISKVNHNRVGAMKGNQLFPQKISGLVVLFADPDDSQTTQRILMVEAYAFDEQLQFTARLVPLA